MELNLGVQFLKFSPNSTSPVPKISSQPSFPDGIPAPGVTQHLLHFLCVSILTPGRQTDARHRFLPSLPPFLDNFRQLLHVNIFVGGGRGGEEEREREREREKCSLIEKELEYLQTR